MTAIILVASAPASAAPVRPVLFPLPAAGAGATSLTEGPDGNVWVTESASGKIARVTPDGAVTEFGLPVASSYPADIVPGGDGNLWFGERHGNSIGRITPAGLITEFKIPGVVAPASASDVGRAGPLDLTAGPDAAVWFLLPVSAERSAPRDELYRMAFDGSVSKFALPAGGEPSSLAAGSDGNVWVTLEGRRQVARVTPTGTVSAFAIPAGTRSPAAIAAAPGGGLDFTVTGKGGIGIAHVDPAGAATVLLAPAKPYDFLGLAAGSDGNRWSAGELGGPGGFTPNDRLTRIAGDGTVTDFDLPVGARPAEVAAGPGGAIWFTEFAGNAVGRLPTGGDPVPRRRLPLGPSVSPAKVSAAGGRLRVVFKTPEYLPLSPPVLPGDDSADGEGPASNEPAGFVLSVSPAGETQGRSCAEGESFSILPEKRRGVSNVYAPDAGRTRRKVTLDVRLRPRLCRGLYRVSLTYGYQVSAGPASDFFPIIDYPKTTAVRVR